MATISRPEDSSGSYTIMVLTQADSVYTLDRAYCPCIIVNTGASGATEVTLPQDAKAGDQVIALCLAAQDILLAPSAAGAVYASDGTTYAKQTDDKNINGDNIGECITLVSLGDGDWIAINQQTVDEAAESFSEVES